MTTITRERIAQYANDPRMCNVNDEIRQIARIALASLTAEPVAWIAHARTGDQLTADGGYVANAEGILGLHSTPLYVAPPAPVVPPEQNWQELCRQHQDMSIGDAIIRASWWNLCRAAMLQAGNDSTNGKPLAITLPDTSSKAFWSGTGKTEIFHPETYKRWVKEAIERACVITGIRVVVK